MLIVCGAGLVAAPIALPVPRAEAQAVFDTWSNSPSKVRKAKRRAAERVDKEAKKAADKKAEGSERKPLGPLVINVSLNRQRLTVFDATGPIAESPVSSGRVGFPTPTGVFTVLQKKRTHYSNLYAGASMPNMQRLTWSGVALHAGVLPGYPASHGCIRLPHGFSSKLFGMTRMGTRVIVSRDPVKPVPFAHERLFAAYPTEDELAAAGLVRPATQVADASHAATGTGDAVSTVLGVTAAAAAERVDAGPSIPSARERFLARRQAEEAKLLAEIRTAGYERAAKEMLLAEAHKAAEAARAPLVEARAEAERLAAALAELERSKAAAEREYAELTKPVDETDKKKRRAKRAMDESKRIAKVLALEAKLARLPSEIEVVRPDWQAADAAFREAEAVAKEAEAKRRAAMNEVMKVNAVLSQALAKEEAARKLAAKRTLPVSVFVSRAKQRLYVRLGYDDIFNAEVTFDRPDEPIGTHVFTALAYAPEKAGMTWSAVSVPYDPSRSKAKKPGKDKSGKAKPAAPPAAQVSTASQTAQAALDRITIPEDVREQIADVMKPGSSLVISDLGIGNETGKYTDFIVPIR